MDQSQEQDHPVAVNRPDLPLVTLDNNVLIALENGEEQAPFVQQLLNLNRERRIRIIITVSTMLERQRDGQEIDIQQFVAKLQALGIAADCIFVHDLPMGFQLPGEPNGIIFDIGIEGYVRRGIHDAVCPNVPYMWCDYLDQEWGSEYERLDEARLQAYREALADLDQRRNRGNVPPTPNLLGEWPLQHFLALSLDEQHELEAFSSKLHKNWLNKKNDSLGLYTHLTHAQQTTCPEHSIFVTSDKHFLKQKTLHTLRHFGFHSHILPPDGAVAYVNSMLGVGSRREKADEKEGRASLYFI